jgi:uncharacterized membrane protein
VALAAIGAAVHLIPVSTFPVVVIGATIGSLAESVLGATLEADGIVNNDVLNFANTAIAALTAIFLVQAFQ